MSRLRMGFVGLPFVLMIYSIVVPWKTIPIDPSLAWCQASDRRIPQPSVCGIGDIVWNASGCYLLDLEQGVAYDVKVSHVSSVGEFLIRNPSGGVVEGYQWENPPGGGIGMLVEASSSGIYSLEIEGVCHVQVSRSLWMMVGEDAVTLRGVLGENRSVYGYYIWIFQSGSEHPSDLVEVEVKLEVPEGADFNLYEADMFFTEPFPAEDRKVEDQEERFVFDNGPEGLLLFVWRASGEGEYIFTVRAYVAYWKIYWHLPAILVVVILAISGIAALSRIASKKESLIDRSKHFHNDALGRGSVLFHAGSDEPPSDKNVPGFQSIRASKLGLTRDFGFAIAFVALALSICLQFAFGMKRMPLGLLNFLAIVFLLYLGYRCIRLQRLGHIFETDLEAMVSLTFGFFVLSQLVSLLNSTAGRILSLVDIYPFLDTLTIARSVSISSLQAIFGFSLFKLASPVFDGRKLDTGNLKFILICLITQGIGGIISISGFISDWHLSGFTPYPLMNMSFLVGWVGGLVQEIAFLVLAVDVFLKRSIRRRAGYATLLSMGTAWLLSWVSVLLRNILSVRVYDMLWNPPGTVASALPMILSSILTIIVSFFLVRGAKLEGKIMKLSSVAVFLFVGGWLLAVPYLIYDCSLRIVAEPSLVFDPRVFTIPTGLTSLPYNILLLTVGLLLYRRSIDRSPLSVVER